MDFIPADESRLITWFFDWYTRLLLRLRFRHLWLKQEYYPGKNSKTIYYLNHNSWWDGLIPLFLNRKYFQQNARALMEDKQMKKYPFFSKIGAFSIDTKNPKSALRSLRYAISSLEKTNSCLFIYPEGKIVHPSDSKPEFREGLAWLGTTTEGIDFVPIALHIHSFRHSKPELYVYIGKSVEKDNHLSRNELNNLFETRLHELLLETRSTAGYSDKGFHQIF